MIMLMYSALLTLALSGWTLRYLLPILRPAEGRKDLTARFGRNAAALAAVVSGKHVIWVQAVSVGEVLTATRLIAELQAALGDGWCIVVSTTTRTGQTLAQEKFGAERVFTMPLDFAFAVRAYLRVLQPKAIILIESEVWPRMMHEARKAAIPIAVVNARVSDRSFNRSRKFRWLWSRVLRQSTLWLAQSEEDARRLIELGARPGSVTTAGNLKYDIRAPKQSRMAELLREAAAGRQIVVAGSTVDDRHASEEQVFLQAAMGPVWQSYPDTLLVLAPRHPERFAEVTELASTVALTICATKLLERGSTKPIVERIVILDTIGDLAAVYGIADVAFVGGSLVPKGGHNPLEPAQYAVPVVMGPHFENFRDIVSQMQAASGIAIVSDEFACHEALINLLGRRPADREIGQRGRAVFESQQGATARTVAAILSMMEEAKP